MNNKGFIATGLIYTFFLIFLTLFLTTITNHIKNKVNLSYVEDGIKEELNSSKSIRDFEPGDLISFVTDCSNAGNFIVDNSYIVASVNSNNLVLYSYGLKSNSTESLTFDNIKSDISTGYLNATYINEIIYNFDTSSYKSYNIGEGIYASVDNSALCESTDLIYCNNYGKITSTGESRYRKRIIKTFTNNKVTKCKIEDAMGVIYVKES